MDEVEALQELLNANYKEIIYSIVIVVIVAVVLKKLYNEFIQLFHIETPTMRQERDRKAELKNMHDEIKDIKQELNNSRRVSDEADEKMNEQISQLNELLKSLTVASMRSTLWRQYTEATEQGYITQEGLKTFLECGKVYESAGGDDIYHSKLYPEVMALHIHEQGEVIENDE